MNKISKKPISSIGYEFITENYLPAGKDEYHLRNNERMYHFDLYRVKSKAELQEFGFEDYLYRARYVFIEWPEVAMDNIYEPSFLRIREEEGKRVFEF